LWQVFFNAVIQSFLFYSADRDQWSVGSRCGDPSSLVAGYFLTDTDYPHIGVNAKGRCLIGSGFFYRPMISVYCSLYSDECDANTYSVPPNCEPCPPHLPLSPTASTNIASCHVSHDLPLFVVSSTSDTVVALNYDSVQRSTTYKLVAAGRHHPADLQFKNPTTFWVTSEGVDKVQLMDIEGKVLETCEFKRPQRTTPIANLPQLQLFRCTSFLLLLFTPPPPFVHFRGCFSHSTRLAVANVGLPVGLLYLPDKDLLIVASRTERSVLFFKASEADLPAAPLHKVKFAQSGAPQYLSVGERDNEILVTNSQYTSHRVLRLCIPETGCDPARDQVTMSGGGSEFSSIATLRPKQTYLIVDRGNFKVFECSLLADDLSAPTDCSIFAFKPDGETWDPFGVLYDEQTQIVYVTDSDFTKLMAFTQDGEYLGEGAGPTGDLINPGAMAIKPGVHPPLSALTSPDTATAGEPIQISLSLATRKGDALPPSYDIAAEAGRYKIRATGDIVSGEAAAHGALSERPETRSPPLFASPR